MMNYSQIYKNLTKTISERTKEVFNRRFGIGRKERHTLESVGKSMGITRERVRQIEKNGFLAIKKQKKELLAPVFQFFSNYFKKNGGFAKEEKVLSEVGEKNEQPYVLFFLTLGDQFFRVCEKKDFYSFWTIFSDKGEGVIKTLTTIVADLKKINHPLPKKDFFSQFGEKYKLTPATLFSYFDISKNIKENKDGKIGLIEWPEIHPRGTRDKAFLVFQKENKPLHFTTVASLIDKYGYSFRGKKALPQTVHNELIKDPRFVLVGRGMYALREWGYAPGTVKDILIKIMTEADQPLDGKTLVEKVLSQRIVAKNTVLMNLNDKKYFLRDEQGKYILRKTQTA